MGKGDFYRDVLQKVGRSPAERIVLLVEGDFDVKLLHQLIYESFKDTKRTAVTAVYWLLIGTVQQVGTKLRYLAAVDPPPFIVRQDDRKSGIDHANQRIGGAQINAYNL